MYALATAAETVLTLSAQTSANECSRPRDHGPLSKKVEFRARSLYSVCISSLITVVNGENLDY